MIRLLSRFMAALVAVLILAPAVLAASPAIPALNPPPPDFETCHLAGLQTICTGTRTIDAGLEPTGIMCGEGADAFEIYDDGGTLLQHATRWYDENGDLTKRLIGERWLDSAWTNPLTGESVQYVQSGNLTDVLATPGDLGSATQTITGATNFVLPGGAIVSAGRLVFDSDGTLEFRSGHQAFLAFENGDASVFDPICEALAGTP
jgi:hypothetical protein